MFELGRESGPFRDLRALSIRSRGCLACANRRNGSLVAVAQLIADRYELKEIVGSGGMSSVYCAFDKLLERHVALKILHEQFGADEAHVERFRREARAVAQLSHPNIVTVIDRGEEDGRQFIVFELIEGDDLKQLIDKAGPLPIVKVVELGSE